MHDSITTLSKDKMLRVQSTPNDRTVLLTLSVSVLKFTIEISPETADALAGHLRAASDDARQFAFRTGP